MSPSELMPLLDKGTFAPGHVTTLKNLCDDWYRAEGSVVPFVFLSIFQNMIDRDWDDNQGVPTAIFERFVANVLPEARAVISASSNADLTLTLDALTAAYRDFLYPQPGV
jgi:hypothetical protein